MNSTNSVTGELTVDITSLTGISSALFETFDAERVLCNTWN